MGFTLSFRFASDVLNRRLVTLLKKRRVRHLVDAGGAVHYSPADEDLVENELISSIRSQVYPSWQVLSCPGAWIDRYRQYMTAHEVPFEEELIDNQVWFLLPGRYRPHAWKIAGETPRKKQRVAS